MGNMNIFQFIVPLTFLAIWALTSLLNRDAQPLPPRAVRPPGPPGPRPGSTVTSLRPGAPRDQAARWSAPPTPARTPPGRPAGRPGDDILIIDAEPRRPSAGGLARPDSTPAPRRGSRNRASQAAPPKRQDAPTPRALTASMGQESGQLNRHMELNPLAKLQAPLSAPVGQEVAATPHTPPLSASLAALSSTQILAQLNTPAKLREAIILNEILSPPLALRGDRRMGHHSS